MLDLRVLFRLFHMQIVEGGQFAGVELDLKTGFFFIGASGFINVGVGPLKRSIVHCGQVVVHLVVHLVVRVGVGVGVGVGRLGFRLVRRRVGTITLWRFLRGWRRP